MNCDICFEFYNKDERRPMTILPCTHTFCYQCLNELKKLKYKCPKCKKHITNEIPCYALLNLMDMKSDVYSEFKQQIYERVKDIKETQEQLRSECEFKLEQTSNEISSIKSEINKRTSKLISLVKINREKLLYEADCIQSNLSDIILGNLYIQDIRLESNDLNSMKRGQLKSLIDELSRFQCDLNYKLNQLNETTFNYEFEPNRDLNYNNSLIGEISYKSTLLANSNKVLLSVECNYILNLLFVNCLFKGLFNV